jgi:membrane protease YdiL (CAAX protease family)
MTSLIESGSSSAVQRSPRHELSAARAFWLLVRLRLTRWTNRKRFALSGRAAGSPSSKRQPRTHAKAWSVIRSLIWPAAFTAFLSLQSYRLFERMTRDHGADGLQGRAELFASLNVACLLLLALAGNRAWDAQGDDDAEWLSTLPAPAWVLHAAKIGEAALRNPTGWILVFPFFAGLGVHEGLGLLTPLLALALSLPLFLAFAVFGSVIDVVSHAWSRSRVFRVLRLIVPMCVVLLMLLWLSASVASSLSRIDGPLRVDVDLLGGWLNFSSQLPWLPFSEPAKALLSLRRAPLEGLAWLGSYGAQMAALLGAGLLLLRRAQRADLVHGRVALRGARVSRRPGVHSARQRPFGSWLGPVIMKELHWLWRNPSRSAGFGFSVVMLNGMGVLLVPRLSGLDAAQLPGLLMLGVGAVLIAGVGSALLELEQPALWQWATLPRSIAWVFGHKTLSVAVLTTVSALPAALYALRLAPSFRAAAPWLFYAATCNAIVALAQTALWLRRASPSSATSPLRNLWRSAQVLLVAAFQGIGFLPSANAAQLVPFVVLVAAFVVAHWQTSVERLPFALDSSSRPSATLTTTFALVAILVTRTLQVQLSNALLRAGSAPSRAATVSVLVAGAIGLTLSVLWLKLRGVPGLRERFGLGAGKGLRVIVREGVLWSLPAIVVNLGYWTLLEPWLASRASGQGSSEPTVMAQLGGSSLAVFAVGAVAVPVIEEILFRGMLHRALRSTWGIAFSVLVGSVVFTVDHTLIAAMPIFFGSVCITLAFERSRSLYSAMLVHALYNGFIGVLMVLR